jgi:pimeloyl-ACP methyl ester carboxylesterase
LKLALFRRRHPERRVGAGGLAWGVIDIGGRPGAPTLLMLPGTLGTAPVFWNQIVPLGRRARVVSVTYPAVADIGRLADGLDRLMRRLGIRRASVVGSSLGGYLGQMLAARHPGRVGRLIIGNSLADPATTREITGRRDWRELARWPGSRHRAIVLGSVRRWPGGDPAQAALKRLLLASGTVEIDARALKARVLAVQTGGAVPPLALPASRIAIIDCADDPLLGRAVQDDVVRRYPGAAHYRLPTGGHYPYVLQAAAYTAILARHLA